MSPGRKKLRVGDVFRLPLDDTRVGYGQIVHKWEGPSYYFAIFDGTYPAGAEPDLDEIVRRPIVLLARSLDALLWHDVWEVVGHTRVDVDNIPWAAYREGLTRMGSCSVVDYTGERRRSADTEGAELLPFRVGRRVHTRSEGVPRAQRDG